MHRVFARRDDSPFQEERAILKSYRDRLKEGSQGCVNSRPAARGSQDAGFTQPREHFLADQRHPVGARGFAVVGPESVAVETRGM